MRYYIRIVVDGYIQSWSGNRTLFKIKELLLTCVVFVLFGFVCVADRSVSSVCDVVLRLLVLSSCPNGGSAGLLF